MKSVLRAKASERLVALHDERLSWWQHWFDLATFILPRRYRWLTSPNQRNRGSQVNTQIIDSTGTVAARVLASGMMSGVTSPTRPWFRLRIEGVDTDTGPGAEWLSDCQKILAKIFQESNFYTSMAVMYLDLAIFGTALDLIFEDDKTVITCFNPCIGEFYFATDAAGRVNVVGREMTKTVAQLVEEFGEENVGTTVRRLYFERGKSLQQEFLVRYILEPNTPGEGALPLVMKYREIYWLDNGPTDEVLRVKGFHEWPALTPRWDVASNDAYGRSPAMDALGDIKQLQQETKRKAQAIDKMVNPPLIADIQLKNQPASLLPGGVTYISGMANGNPGMKPVFQVTPPLVEIKEDIKEIQERIKTVFFNDLFMMISNLDTVRTATEIDARREEKLVMLGPVLERFENEALGPAIERVWAIALRRNLFPSAPPDLRGKPIDIQYVSMLAEAQRAVATSGIERWLSLMGNLAGVDPSVMDNADLDETLREYGGLLAVPPKLMRSADDMAKLRAARAQQQQAAEAANATPGLAQAAGNLAKVRVGNGQTALDAVMGNGQGGSGGGA